MSAKSLLDENTFLEIHEYRRIRTILAIRNKVFNPSLNIHTSLGGWRVSNSYKDFGEARDDALRLALGMDRKRAIANVSFGGAKMVTWGNPEELLRDPYFMNKIVGLVKNQNGGYVTAEDVGTSTDAMKKLRSLGLKWVSGLPKEMGGSGDPSPVTARGVFESIKICLKHVYGYDSCKDRRFVIQGVGHVGANLLELIYSEGGKVMIADTNYQKVAEVMRAFPDTFRVTFPDVCFNIPCDVFVPCALGGILNEQTIPHLESRIVCGAANNQLATPEDGDALYEKGIVYAPDYLVNAGGLISATDGVMYEGFYDESIVMRRVQKIATRLENIFLNSSEKNTSPHRIADAMADELIKTVPN